MPTYLALVYQMGRQYAQTMIEASILALQIRQNTSQLRENARALRLAEGRAATDGEVEFHRLLLADPELDSIFRRGRHGEELNSDDLARFTRLLMVYMLRCQLLWRQAHESVFPEAYWDRLAIRPVRYLSNDAAQRWWASNRIGFDSRFVADIEQRLNETSPAA